MKFVFNPKFVDSDRVLPAKEKITKLEKDLDDVLVVSGWDWAFLHYIKEHSEYNKFLPIWVGTRNFLMNLDKTLEFDSFDDFEEVKMKLLKVKITTSVWEYEDSAFNDVYLNTTLWRMWDLNVSWDDIPMREVYWDWIIICTAQWSTWYNKNAGWVVLPLWADVIWITDINSIDWKSYVVNNQKITVTPFKWNFTGFVDSRKYENIEKVEILGYDKEISVYYLKKNNFEKNRYL